MKSLLLTFFILFSTASRADINDSLIFAVKAGDIEKARSLLSAGADPNTKTSLLSWPAIQVAAKSANPDMIALLLEFKADPNLRSPAFTPLGRAIRSDCLDCVKLLVEAGVNVMPKDLVTAQDWERQNILDYFHNDLEIKPEE